MIPEDHIISGSQLSAYLKETETKQKLVSPEDCIDETIDYLFPSEEKVGDSLPFPGVQEDMKFRPSELTVWSGYNGHGKSLLLGQLMSHIVFNHRKRICIASMEMSIGATLGRIVRQLLEARKPDKDHVVELLKTVSPYIWLYDHMGVAKAHEVIAMAKYCGDELKMNHVVIDSLMKCGLREDDYSAQIAFVDELTSVARDYKMHIHLVAHSKKNDNENIIPGKMDVKGTGTITDLADNVIVVWRNKLKGKQGCNPAFAEIDGLMSVSKQRHSGWEGAVGLNYYYDSESFTQGIIRKNDEPQRRTAF